MHIKSKKYGKEEGHGKDNETTCQGTGEKMRTRLGTEGDERLACGETLKPERVKTRLPDLRGGRSQAKQKRRRAQT